MHAQGYAGASVRDIVQAAGVPQGSFTNHFASKEAFGLEIIERYFVGTQENLRATLRNDDLPPLQRFEAFLDVNINLLKEREMQNGCLFGNFAIETSDHSEAMRLRLVAIFKEIETSIAYCLKAALAAGELAADTDCDDMAAFMVASLQGAQLMVKVQKNVAAMERLKHVFLALLRPNAGPLPPSL